MARAETRFTVARPKGEVLAFLGDPTQVRECLAFVAGTETTAEGVRWRVKAPMSAITQTPHLDVAFQGGGDQVRWQARGRHLDIRGTFAVATAAGGATEGTSARGVQSWSPWQRSKWAANWTISSARRGPGLPRSRTPTLGSGRGDG